MSSWICVEQGTELLFFTGAYLCPDLGHITANNWASLVSRLILNLSDGKLPGVFASNEPPHWQLDQGYKKYVHFVHQIVSRNHFGQFNSLQFCFLPSLPARVSLDRIPELLHHGIARESVCSWRQEEVRPNSKSKE